LQQVYLGKLAGCTCLQGCLWRPLK